MLTGNDSVDAIEAEKGSESSIKRSNTAASLFVKKVFYGLESFLL